MYTTGVIGSRGHAPSLTSPPGTVEAEVLPSLSSFGVSTIPDVGSEEVRPAGPGLGPPLKSDK
jgi:hypothetical protein